MGAGVVAPSDCFHGRSWDLLLSKQDRVSSFVSQQLVSLFCSSGEAAYSLNPCANIYVTRELPSGIPFQPSNVRYLYNCAPVINPFPRLIFARGITDFAERSLPSMCSQPYSRILLLWKSLVSRGFASSGEYLFTAIKRTLKYVATL